MAEDNQSAESLRRLSRQRFEEEVARELGIDLNTSQRPGRDGSMRQVGRSGATPVDSEH